MRENILALSSFNVPVQTILVRKVGALFLRSLFYYLDRFKLPKDPHDLENGEGLNFELPLPMIYPVQDVRFVFYRDPLDRLIAFYFDQLYVDSPRVWDDWRQVLIARGAKFAPEITRSQHQKNLRILLDYIVEQSREKGFISLPDQLAPQYKFLLPAVDLGFKPIDLARANFELETMLEPHVFDIGKILKKIEKLAQPITTYNVREVVSADALKQHRAIYEGDFELYWAYRDGAA